MDATLTAILRALFEAHQTVDLLRQQNQQLQADYTDLKAEHDACNANRNRVA